MRFYLLCFALLQFKEMKTNSHIISMETFEGMPSVKYEEFASGKGVTSWCAKSLQMKHYELLATTWICKNANCHHENALRNSACVKCNKVMKTMRGVNIYSK